MKRTIFIMTLLATCAFTTQAKANTNDPADTVVIELSANSKIVIYAENRDELKKIERYDINQMIKDLNEALTSKKIQKIELTDENGEKYTKDTTIVVGDGQAKTRIKIGNMELLIDADEWSEFDEEFEDVFEDDPKEYTYKSKPEDRTQNSFNIDIGLNNWMDGSKFPDAENSPYTLAPFGSWQIGLASSYNTLVSKVFYLDWGFGVSWNNYKLQDSDYTFTKGVDRVELTPTPVEYKTIKSRLSVPYVNVNFVPMFDLSKGTKEVYNWEKGSLKFKNYKDQGVRFGIGTYAGYRIGGNAKLIYRESGNKKKDREQDHFYLQNFRYGLRAQFGFKGLDLFATYDLNEVFSNGKGPIEHSGLHSISFGITL